MLNSNPLITNIPNVNELCGNNSADTKSKAIDFVAAILNAITDEHREPDAWEAQDLACAIGFIGAGMYLVAISFGVRALTPSEERPSLCVIEMPDLVTVKLLRGSLERASA